ncbi:acetyltransferase (GNAT) family protein [Thermosporothrix hazakensis]|uniref:Acetyltransferase (GNAT) family protein n=1 Tax=Thermosporothrix hazakensis TaxID=644383 RepID=A0A326U7R4_THEHA|nr:GNAT family N-acetyltransferase [Thermosporothrix hazakensis]PZW29225.1 acetyltransferase (GNAT) family protein [Thermosporothrix hazakensis]GCE45422.1 hypothetical protein KTH_02910 [Thermosporothrix hazakensis]
MSQYRFSSTLHYTPAEITEMQNVTFSGYFFPQTMTPEMAAEVWRCYDVDMVHTVVMHSLNLAFVGLARLALRGWRGWCGGFGIVPRYRGTGASTHLAERMIYKAREAGLKTIQLEVLHQNIPAQKLYKRVGFETLRQLLSVEIATKALPESPALEVEELDPERLFPWVAFDVRPSWQRELASIATLKSRAYTLAGKRFDRPTGLITERRKAHLRILAAINHTALTDGELLALLRHAAGDAVGIQLINEPEESALLRRCRDFGFFDVFGQYEMFLTL